MQKKPSAQENKRGSYSNVWFTYIGFIQQAVIYNTIQEKTPLKRDSDE
jgi:hypothetical protein